MFKNIDLMITKLSAFNEQTNNFLLSLEKLESVAHLIEGEELKTPEAEIQIKQDIMAYDKNGPIYRGEGYHYDEHGKPCDNTPIDYSIEEREEILKDLEK